MKKQVSLLSNYIFNLIKTFTSLLFPLITFTYSARILGVDGIGRVNFAKSVVTYFSLFAALGADYYGTREVAKRREDKRELSKFVHEMLFINGGTTVLAYVLLALAVVCVPKLHGYELLIFINSFSILLKVMGVEWLYQGLEEYRYIAVRTVLFQIISLVVMFLFVRDADDVAAFAVVSTLASSGSYVLNFVNARKHVSLTRFSHYEIKRHFKPLLWLFVLCVSMELYTVLDSTMLGFISGDAAVGRYTAAVKVNKLTNTLISAVGIVLIPRLAFYIGQKKLDEVRILVEKAYNFVFLLSVPAAVGLFMLSDEIILLFSGKGFASAAHTMRLLTPIVLVIPFSIATNQQTLIPMGKEKLMLIATSCGAMVNLLCNAFLIPRYAENGAAVATVLAETAVAGVSFVNASKYFDMKRMFSKYYQYVLAATPIPLIALGLKHIITNLILRTASVIVLSVGCYFALLMLFRNAYASEAFTIIRKKITRR